jgi:hypothetical protein
MATALTFQPINLLVGQVYVVTCLDDVRKCRFDGVRLDLSTGVFELMFTPVDHDPYEFGINQRNLFEDWTITPVQ